MALFFTLGMFVSSRTSRSNISFLVLLFIWVICTLVIPKGSVIVAGQFIQVPSIYEHRMRLNQVFRDIYRTRGPDYRKYTQDNPPPKRARVDRDTPKGTRDAIMAEYKKAREAWHKERQAWMQEQFAKINEVREAEEAKMKQDYRNKQQALAELAVGLSRISPASAMTYASMNLAGTSIEAQEHFLALARSHRELFISYIESKGVPKSGMVFSRPEDKPKPVDTSDMPAFQQQTEPLADALGRITVDIVLMSLLSLAFFIGAYFSFLRYDVR